MKNMQIPSKTEVRSIVSEMKKFYDGLLTERGIRLAAIGRVEKIYGKDAAKEAVKQKMF